MSALSLLFSSDEETSRALIQTLKELELEVEHCPEIFAAVEKITSRSFDIIVCDWQEGLEAAFLLKSARELKANSGAFTIAVADADSASAAREAGANFVLRLPIVPEKAKYALLTCDEFLRHMRTWLPKLGFPTAEETASQSAGHKSRFPNEKDQAEPATARTHRPSPPLRGEVTRIPAPVLASPNFEDHHASHFGIQTLFSTLAESEPDEKPRSRYSRSLLTTALGVALLSAGYVFSEPLRNQSVTIAVAKIYGRALEKTHVWLDRSNSETPPPSQVAQNDSLVSPHARTGSLHIRITPVPESSAPAQPTPNGSQPPLSSAEIQPALVATNVSHIPNSLQAPIQANLRDVSSRVTSSLLGSLEPVTLSEELAQKMVLQKVSPSYPERALKAGLQGSVVLQAWIARDGTIRDLKLIRGSFLLGQAAYKAVRQWRYQPYLLNGQAVETQTYVTVDFRLP
jgi:TonB family protein